MNNIDTTDLIEEDSVLDGYSKYFEEPKILLFVSVLFLLVSLYSANITLFYFDIFIITFITLIYFFEFYYSANIRAYRKMRTTAFTDDTVKVEIGVSNFNPVSFYNVEVKDNFRLKIHQDIRILLQPHLNAKKITTGIYSGKCSDRIGCFFIGPISVTLSDPFGIACITKVFDVIHEITVYPKGFNLDNLSLFSRASQFNVNIKNSPSSGVSDEFRGIREYVSGDALRRIHWKISLRYMRLIVKDFEMPASKNVFLILDLNQKTHKGLGKFSTFEYIAQSAMGAAIYAQRMNYKIGILAQGRDFYYIPPASGTYQLKKIMDFLLFAKQDGNISFDKLLAQSLPLLPIDSSVILIFSASLIDLDDYADAIKTLQNRYISVVVILINDNLFLRVKENDYSHEELFNSVKSSFESLGIKVFTIDEQNQIL